MANEEIKINLNGGLTLVPMPGFEKIAEEVKRLIEDLGTPTDIVYPVFGERASGEPFLRLGKEHIGDHDCVVLTSGPGTYKMLVQLQILLGYLAGRRAKRITLVSGYLPLTRSDKDEGELELALVKLIVDLIVNASYGELDRIVAADLHAAQETSAGWKMGLITEVSLARLVLSQAIEDAKQLGMPFVILFPDEGAKKRFEKIIKNVSDKLSLEIPVVIGQKRREDSRNSKLMRLEGDVDKLEGSLVIAFDDEIASGGTMIQTALAIKEEPYKAKIFWGIAVHGVLCDPAPKLFMDPNCPVERIYITSTIPVDNRPELQPLLGLKRLKVVSWNKDLAQIIHYHHWGKSIREMR